MGIIRQNTNHLLLTTNNHRHAPSRLAAGPDGGRCGVTATGRRGRPVQEPTLYGHWPGMQQQEPVLWPKQNLLEQAQRREELQNVRSVHKKEPQLHKDKAML